MASTTLATSASSLRNSAVTCTCATPLRAAAVTSKVSVTSAPFATADCTSVVVAVSKPSGGNTTWADTTPDLPDKFVITALTRKRSPGATKRGHDDCTTSAPRTVHQLSAIPTLAPDAATAMKRKRPLKADGRGNSACTRPSVSAVSKPDHNASGTMRRALTGD